MYQQGHAEYARDAWIDSIAKPAGEGRDDKGSQRYGYDGIGRTQLIVTLGANEVEHQEQEWALNSHTEEEYRNARGAKAANLEKAEVDDRLGHEVLKDEEDAPSSDPVEQEQVPIPVQLPTSLAQEEREALSQQNAARHKWTLAWGAQDRSVTGRGSQRLADLQVSTTNPDATIMLHKDGSHLGYQTHYVVDGGKSHIILTVLVTPAEVMENQPMRGSHLAHTFPLETVAAPRDGR